MCALVDSSSNDGAAAIPTHEEQEVATAAQNLRNVSSLQNSIKFTAK